MDHPKTPPAALLFPSYEQLAVDWQPDPGIVWYSMCPRPRPCFNATLLTNLLSLLKRVATSYDLCRRAGTPIRYLVWSSDMEGIFNLGGDLGLFVELIRAGDTAAIRRYAYQCIDIVYQTGVNLGLPVTTIALVQGDALGGGFEAALSCDHIVAERQAKLGLPEILFNLFPGMGAYSFLARKIGIPEAERMIASGRQFSAEELHDRGVVDALAEPGRGVDATHRFIAEHGRRRNALLALRRARECYSPVTYRELKRITDIWVEATQTVTERDLRVMERLVRAQARKAGAPPPAVRSEAG